MSARNIVQHYKRIAHSYDELWEYSEPFIEWMTDEIQARLAASQQSRIADIGGGTGIYSKRLAERLNPTCSIRCVDPSVEMLKGLGDAMLVEPKNLGAVEYVETRPTIDRAFMKEAIHHIPDKQRFFDGLGRCLDPGGVFVLALLPPTIDYPLFQAALTRYEEQQPHYAELEEMLRRAGFFAVTTMSSFRLRIAKARYAEMIRERYMSLLSTFSDEEIEAGIAELEPQWADLDELEFDDRFVFMSCVRR